MKKIFLLVIALMLYNFSYSQHDKKLKNQDPVIPEDAGLSQMSIIYQLMERYLMLKLA